MPPYAPINYPIPGKDYSPGLGSITTIPPVASSLKVETDVKKALGVNMGGGNSGSLPVGAIPSGSEQNISIVPKQKAYGIKSVSTGALPNAKIEAYIPREDLVNVGSVQLRSPSNVMGRSFIGGGSLVKGATQEVVSISTSALTGLGTKSIYQGAEQIIPRAGTFVFEELIPQAPKAIIDLGKRTGIGTGLIGIGEAIGQIGTELPESGRTIVKGVTESSGQRKGIEEALDNPEATKADTELYKKINQYYSGGTEQTVDEQGKVLSENKKEGAITNPVQGFLYNLPMVDIADPTRGKENVEQITKFIKETHEEFNPEYRKLSDADKERFAAVKFKEEYIGGKTGAFGGTIAIETGSEFQGAGALFVLPGSGKGKVVNVLRTALTGAVVGGFSEAPKSIKLQEKTERMEYTPEERFYAQGTGALSGAIFMGASTWFTPTPTKTIKITPTKAIVKTIPDPKKELKEYAGEAIELIGTVPPYGDIGEPLGNFGRTFIEIITKKKFTPTMSFVPTITKSDTTTFTKGAISKQTVDKTDSGALVKIEETILNRAPTTPIKPIGTTISVRPDEVIPPVPVPPKIPEPVDVQEQQKVSVNMNYNIDTRTDVPIRVITPAGGMPLIPFIGGGEFGNKTTKRERTRFIDEFTLAFSGLARPSEPTYFGKQKSIAKTRQLFKPKKKSKRRGGVNYAAIFA